MAHELAIALDVAGITYRTLICMQESLTAVMGVLQGEKVSEWSEDFLERLKVHYIKPEFWQNMTSLRSIENKYIDFTSACALLSGYFYSSRNSYRSRDNASKRIDFRRVNEEQETELRAPMLASPYYEILFERLFPEGRLEDEEREELLESFREQFRSERNQIEDLRKKRNELFGHPTQSLESLKDDASTASWYRMIIDFRMFLRDFWAHHIEGLKAYFPGCDETDQAKELYGYIEKTDDLVHECFAVKNTGKSETYKFDRTEYDISKDDISAVVPLTEEMALKWNTGKFYLKNDAQYLSLHNFMSYRFESQNDVIELGNIRDRMVKRMEQGQPADIEYMDFLYHMCPELNGIYWKGQWGTESMFARRVLQMLCRHQNRHTKEEQIYKLVDRIDGADKDEVFDISIKPMCQYRILSTHFAGNISVLKSRLKTLKQTYEAAVAGEQVKTRVRNELAELCGEEAAERVFSEIMNTAEDVSTQMDGERERYLRNASDEKIASLEFEKELQYVVTEKITELERVFARNGLFHKDSDRAKVLLGDARKIALKFDESSSEEAKEAIAATEKEIEKTKEKLDRAQRFEKIIIEAADAPSEKEYFAAGNHYAVFMYTILDLIKALKGFATYISPIIEEGSDKPVILRTRDDIRWYLKKRLLEANTVGEAYEDMMNLKNDLAFQWFLREEVR